MVAWTDWTLEVGDPPTAPRARRPASPNATGGRTGWLFGRTPQRAAAGCRPDMAAAPTTSRGSRTRPDPNRVRESRRTARAETNLAARTSLLGMKEGSHRCRRFRRGVGRWTLRTKRLDADNGVTTGITKKRWRRNDGDNLSVLSGTVGGCWRTEQTSQARGGFARDALLERGQ